MNNREEDLTLQNVDERVEQFMHIQDEREDASTPLARVAHGLQRVYAEERRLARSWERISNRAQALESIPQQLSTEKAFQGEQKTMRETPSMRPGSFQYPPDGPVQPHHPSRRLGWRNFALGLAAAIVLSAIFAWTIVATHQGHSTQVASGGGTPGIVTPTIVPPGPTPTQAPVTPTPYATPTATPMPTPTVAPSGQQYTCQYFTVGYPSNWVITSSASGGAYLQTTQFRPSLNSTTTIDVSAMYNNDLSAEQLLKQDSIVKQGTLESTKTLGGPGGLTWAVDMIAGTGSVQGQTFEIAYANQPGQSHPYRMELATSTDQYASYSQVFQDMLLAFTPVK